MNVFTILLYAVALYMVFHTISLSKRTKRNRILIDAIQSIKNEDIFMEKINAMIDNEESEFKEKAKVIKLWGLAYHERMANFENVLDTIEVNSLILKDKSGNLSISANEDSFVYLYLAIPELLYYKKHLEERALLRTKLEPFTEVLSDQICVELSKAMDRCFEGTEDKGLAFCEKLLEGDYGNYIYSKQMIGLYKSIAATQCAKVYELRGDTDRYNELLPIVTEFAESGIGSRWVEGLGLRIPTHQEETEEDTDTEDTADTEEAETEEDRMSEITNDSDPDDEESE